MADHGKHFPVLVVALRNAKSKHMPKSQDSRESRESGDEDSYSHDLMSQISELKSRVDAIEERLNKK